MWGGALGARPGADGSPPHCAQGETARTADLDSSDARRWCVPSTPRPSTPAPPTPVALTSQKLQGDGMFGGQDSPCSPSQEDWRPMPRPNGTHRWHRGLRPNQPPQRARMRGCKPKATSSLTATPTVTQDSDGERVLNLFLKTTK